MFSALRQNNTVFVLDKKDTPVLRKGQIIAVTSPKLKIGGYYTNPLDTIVDMDIMIDGSKEHFKNIPANLSVINDGNVVLTETKEQMLQEVEAMYSTSKQILESVPYHNKVVEACDSMLQELNPQFAKDKQQEEKIKVLEEKIGGIETSIGDMKEMLTQALNK